MRTVCEHSQGEGPVFQTVLSGFDSRCPLQPLPVQVTDAAKEKANAHRCDSSRRHVHPSTDA